MPPDMTCRITPLKWKHLPDVREASCAGKEQNWKFKGNDLNLFLEKIKQLRVFPSSALMCAYSWTIFEFIEGETTSINFLLQSNIENLNQIGCFLKSVDVNTEKPNSCIDREALVRFQKDFLQSCAENNDKRFDVFEKEFTMDRRFAPLGFDYYQEVEGHPTKFCDVSLERIYTDTRTTKRYLTLSTKHFPRDSFLNLRFEYSENVFDSALIEKVKDRFILNLRSIINLELEKGKDKYV